MYYTIIGPFLFEGIYYWSFFFREFIIGP